MPVGTSLIHFTASTRQVEAALKQFALQMTLYGSAFVHFHTPKLPNATEYHRLSRHRSRRH